MAKKCFIPTADGRRGTCIEKECQLWIIDDEYPSYSYNEDEKLTGIYYSGACAIAEAALRISDLVDIFKKGTRI
jgi:hypothetical protein